LSIRLYMDVHFPYAVTVGLRLRGVDVLTAREDGTNRHTDSNLLDRATNIGRVLSSQDDDLLREAKARQVSSKHFLGVIFAHQLNATIGQCVEDLELIASASELESGPVELFSSPLK